jgi:hypothetical protein
MRQLTRLSRRNRSAMTRHPIEEKNHPRRTPSSSAPQHEADDVFPKMEWSPKPI